MTEHERIVIGSTIRDNRYFDELRLGMNDFSSKEARTIWRGIGEVINNGLTADLVTLYDSLPDIEPGLLASLTNSSNGNLEHHAEKIRECGRLDKLYHIQLAIGDALQSKKTSSEILDVIDKQLSEISEQRMSESTWIRDCIMAALDDLEKRAQNPGRIIGVPSGYADFDSMTSGFQPGEFYVLAARPGIGKTALALCMTARQAIQYEKSVGFFSCEMSKNMIVQRLLAITGNFNLQKVRRGYPTKTAYHKMTDGAGQLYVKRILINDTPGISLADLRMEARMMRRRGIEIIWVDYLTLIKHGDRGMPKHEQVGEISKALKNLARELNIPVVALSQVRRNAEGSMPSLADLRQSGEIEEDADLIMFLDRERKEKATTLNIAKNRNGPTGELNLVFLPEQAKFEERVDKEHET